ncbi:MAG: ATP-binding protein [Gemmataceae bacterium]
MIRRPLGLFSLTAMVVAVAVLVAGGLGWVTVSSLKVEDEQRLAETLTQRNEKERLALWRLDNRIYLSLGLEGYRKYEDYTALYTPPGEPPGCTSYLSRLVVAEIPDWMHLHVQLDPTTGWSSPQVLPAKMVAQLRESNPELKLFNLTDENRKRLEEWTRRMPVALASRELKSAETDLPETSAIMVAGMDANEDPKKQNNRDLKPQGGRAELAPLPSPSQMSSRGNSTGRGVSNFNSSSYLGNQNFPNTSTNPGVQAGNNASNFQGRGGQADNPSNDTVSRARSNDNLVESIQNGIGLSQQVKVNPQAPGSKAVEALTSPSLTSPSLAEKENLMAKELKSETESKKATNPDPVTPALKPQITAAKGAAPTATAVNPMAAAPSVAAAPAALSAPSGPLPAEDKFKAKRSPDFGKGDVSPGAPGGFAGGMPGGVGGSGGGGFQGGGMGGPPGGTKSFGGGGPGSGIPGTGAAFGGIGGGMGGGGMGGGGMGGGVGGVKNGGFENREDAFRFGNLAVKAGGLAVAGGAGTQAMNLRGVDSPNSPEQYRKTAPIAPQLGTTSTPSPKPTPKMGEAPLEPPAHAPAIVAAPSPSNSPTQTARKMKADDAAKDLAETAHKKEEKSTQDAPQPAVTGLVKNQPESEKLFLPLATQKPAPSVPALPVDLGPMRPKWVTDDEGNNVLIVFRPARLESKVVYQGIWIDWEKLCELLREEYSEDFPEGKLLPNLEKIDDPQNQLASLPVRFEMGPMPVPPAVGWTPLRLGLTLAWIAAAVSLIAVWFGGWSLVDLSERRIRFVSAVTHELRTPLTSLRLYLDMLTSGMIKEEEQKQQYLTTLSHESNRLHHLIENVLDFAKLEKRAASVSAVPVSIPELCEPIRETWQERLAADGKELVIVSTVPSDQRVTVDPRIVQQILGNLIDNARKYSPGAADPRIWLWIKPAGRKIAFEVEDRGPGIPVTERRSIFRPFRRGESSGATGGAGLGLALAKQWAEMSGGRLSYRPAEGGTGSCFRLELPT